MNKDERKQEEIFDNMSSADSVSILQSILNGMDAYLYVTDPVTDEVLFINDKMKEHFNLPNGVVNSICWQVLQEGFTERCEFCPNYKLSENPDEMVVWEEHNTVTERYYKNSDSLIKWPDGRLVHMQHSVDITEIKEAEEAVKKRLAQQEIMSRISQSFIAKGDIGELIYEALKITGEFTGMDRIRIQLLDEQDNVMRSEYRWFGDKLKGEAPADFCLPFEPGTIYYDSFITDGKQYLAIDDFESSGYTQYNARSFKAILMIPIYSEERFVGTLEFQKCDSTCHWSQSDIHLGSLIANVFAGVFSRQKIEMHLQRMTSIVTNTPNYVAYSNHEGMFSYINPAVSKMTGYSDEELMKSGIGVMLDDEQMKFAQEEILPRAFKQGTYSFEQPITRKDGSERIFTFSCFVLEDQGESGLGVIGTDITEKNEIEKEAIRAKELAESASKAKSEFLARMSHEIRTPMNAIIGMTSVAQGAEDIAKKDYCLDKIDSASQHLLGVINDILDMSKIEANKFKIICSDFDFEKMLINTTNMINFRVDEKNHDLIVNLEDGVPRDINGDEQRLSQVITNLLSNAVKFTPDYGTIVLDIKKQEQQGDTITLLFSVTDNGIGVSSEQQAKLFHSFEQADGGNSRKFGGTGLGLVISKKIVELMGGRIWMESEVDKGSKVSFTVQVKPGKPQAKIKLNINKNNLNILTVDDSPEIREYFKSVMDSLQIPCEVASDGDDALAKIAAAKEKPYNIFFIDWLMPGMDGIELTRRIKEITSYDSAIIMISAAKWSDIEQEAMQAGASSFVPKPLFPSALVNSINECIGVKQAEPPEEEEPELPPEPPDYSRYTVLLAEDIEINQEIVAALLEDTKVNLEYAENGQEAVRIFGEAPERYDLVFMDIHMPIMDGYEATQRIRQLSNEQAGKVPIVAMTANAFKEDVDKCLKCGMNDHMAKPIDYEILMNKIKYYLTKFPR